MFVGRFLHIEKGFEVIEIFGFLFHLKSFKIVFTNDFVGLLNLLWRGFLDIVWDFILEVLSELSNFNLKLSKSVFNVSSFFVLKWENRFFHWSKSFF